MDFDREQFSDNDDSPMSNSTPRSHSAGEDDAPYHHHRDSPSPQRYLEPDAEEAFAQQQREMLERLREQYTSFVEQPPAPQPPKRQEPTPQQQQQLMLLYHQRLLELQMQQQQQQQIQPKKDLHDIDDRSPPHPSEELPLPSFPTPPPSKGEEEHIASPRRSNSAAKNNSHSNSASYSYDEQYKQVRQLYEINDDPKRKEFLDDLFMFMKERGTPINRLPIMAKSVLDLYELYKLVLGRGGLVNVINKKLWQEIIKDLNLPSSITSAAFTLRTQYVRYLYPYETDKFHLSTESELNAAIENNKRDGSRRSSSNSNNNSFMNAQFSPQPTPNAQLQQQQQQQQQLQQQQMMQLAFIQQLAAASTANNAAAVNSMPATNGSANVQSNSDLSNSQPSAQELAMAQQRFMMMMLMYQQAMQTQSALP